MPCVPFWNYARSTPRRGTTLQYVLAESQGKDSGRVFAETAAHVADASRAAVQKVYHFLDYVDRAELEFKLGQGGRQHQAVAVEDAECFLDRGELRGRKPRPLQADQVDARNAVDSLLDNEWRDILGSGGKPAQGRHTPDSEELMTA